MNIELKTLSEVKDIKGEVGNFEVEIIQHPRYIDESKCIACDTCAQKCPKKIIDTYNMGLSKRKSAYVEYPQAVPLKYCIDADSCIYFQKKGKCGACKKLCPTGAVDFEQKEQIISINVGAVVLSSGFSPFDPSGLDIYKYASRPNVITSMEMERILSASGPTAGHLVRLSDEKEPKKIAWLQCIGSRDINRNENGYCSSVCCMYAIKEAMIAKEHASGELECTIFNMDIRTFGKDYEAYYLRAKDKEGVRFVKSRIHTIDEVKDTDQLRLRYLDEAGSVITEDYDMVVLSVGLTISDTTIDLANRFNIDLNNYNFAVTNPFVPVETSRPGIYACGVLQGPKDIPSCVTEASAAACAAGVNLSSVRNTCTKSVDIPDEIDFEGKEPKVGVFVCNCGTNIAGVVDVAVVEEYAKSLPYVAYTSQNLFSCSQDAQDKMKDIIAKEGLNRVVISACSPNTHEAIFMDTLQACGINKYLFEMANIRNQNSWVHSDFPEQATEKAKELIKMAVARVATLTPLHEKRIPVTQRALVVGGGVAGMNAALYLANQNIEVVLVEKESVLGGIAKNLTKTIEGEDIGKYLKELVDKVVKHSKIEILSQALIKEFEGFKGNFTTKVLLGSDKKEKKEKKEKKVEHGVVIIATGADEYKPKEFFYGQDDRVVTQLELSKQLEEKAADNLNQVVMIQCIGSRNDEATNCSRVCCQTAIKNSLHIKELNPDAQIYILYRDIRTYGLLEDYYTEARRKGILFFRYTNESPPEVELSDEGVIVNFNDHILNKRLEVCADLLTLSAGMRAADTKDLASTMKLARNDEGYFTEAHVKLRPVDMATEGIFVCGTAHGPKLLSESVGQALAAASRATTYLAQPYLTLSAVTAQVQPEKCASCLICVRSCPYDVPRINKEGVSEIDIALCHGCGVCAAECPAKAIELNWYEDRQILSKIEALLEGSDVGCQGSVIQLSESTAVRKHSSLERGW